MRMRTVIVVLLIALMAAFTAANWAAFVAPTPLNLLFASVEAPLGLILLGVLTAVVLAFAVYMAVWQAAVLRESQRHARELQQQRELAEQAEASRYTELRAAMRDEVARLADRLGQLQEGLRTDIRENANSVAACIAEIDDRLRRERGPG